MKISDKPSTTITKLTDYENKISPSKLNNPTTNKRVIKGLGTMTEGAYQKAYKLNLDLYSKEMKQARTLQDPGTYFCSNCDPSFRYLSSKSSHKTIQMLMEQVEFVKDPKEDKGLFIYKRNRGAARRWGRGPLGTAQPPRWHGP